MIKIFKTFGAYTQISDIESSCWINVTAPTKSEIIRLKEEFNLPADIVQDVLDSDERPRIELDEDLSLIIMRIPVETKNNSIPFQTVPLGIFLTEKFTLTLCLLPNEVLPDEKYSIYREQYSQVTDVFNFILRLFLRSGNIYLRYLKRINQQTNIIENDIEKSIKNKELHRLLKMEKCLVYFITSIKANEIVMTRLKNAKKISTEINENLLEDALIENKQALEMAMIYSDIQSGMMDAFASIISNNLNILMKKLTLVSIMLMIPTLIASFFGMNLVNHIENTSTGFFIIVICSISLAFIVAVLFKRKNWF